MMLEVLVEISGTFVHTVFGCDVSELLCGVNFVAFSCSAATVLKDCLESMLYFFLSPR